MFPKNKREKLNIESYKKGRIIMYKNQKMIDHAIRVYHCTDSFKENIKSMTDDEIKEFDRFIELKCSLQYMTRKELCDSYSTMKNEYESLCEKYYDKITTKDMAFVKYIVKNFDGDKEPEIDDEAKEFVENIIKDIKNIIEKENADIEDTLNESLNKEDIKDDIEEVEVEHSKRYSNYEAFAIIAKGKLEDGISYIKERFNIA